MRPKIFVFVFVFLSHNLWYFGIVPKLINTIVGFEKLGAALKKYLKM